METLMIGIGNEI